MNPLIVGQDAPVLGLRDIPLIAGRWFLGLPLDGYCRTDAGWFRPGEEIIWWEDYGLPHKRDWWPRALRALLRWVITAAVVGIYAAYATWPQPTLWVGYRAAVIAAVVLAYVYGWRIADQLLTYRHKRNWVHPTWVAIRDLTGWPSTVNAEHVLYIPPNFNEPGADPIRLIVPAGQPYEDQTTKNIVAGIKTKLALAEQRPVWHLTGRDHYLELLPAVPPPPDKVLFTDAWVRRLVEMAPESAPLIGLSHNGAPVSFDLDADSPHFLINGATGAGKSVVAADLFVQILYWGGVGLVLDYKWFSHKWCRKLPNVKYCKRIEEIHQAWIWAGDELDRRRSIVDAWDDDQPGEPDIGPRVGILFEEANSTMRALKAYWASIRTSDDPKESPALAAYYHVLNMGRAVRMHVILMAQSGSTEAIGGRDARENFVGRALARYTPQTWRMLVSDIWPMPKKTRHIGRWQIVLGSEAHETQVLFIDDPKNGKRRSLLRQWALAGVVTPIGDLLSGDGPLTDSQPYKTASQLTGDAVSLTGRHLKALPTPDDQAPDVPPATLVTLREAIEKGVLAKTTLDQVRYYRANDETFPDEVARDGQSAVYETAALREWEEEKERRLGRAG